MSSGREKTTRVLDLEDYFEGTTPSVVSKVTGEITHGSNHDIDIVAEQMTSVDFDCNNGCLICAGHNNTGVVYVGKSGVTAGTNESTDGFPLNAGDSLVIEVSNVNLIYLIADAENQKVFWVAS